MASCAPAAALALVQTEPSPSDKRPSPRATAEEISRLARIAAGDELALVELVYEYQPALLRLAFILLDDRALAQAVVQETWAGVLAGIARFEGRCAMKRWIFGILIKRARLRVIREARSTPYSAVRHSAWDINPAINLARLGFEHRSSQSKRQGWNDTEEELIEREAKRCLRHSLQQLPLHLRALVTLRDIERLKPDEVSELLGIGEAAQEVHLQRTRARLKRALRKHLFQVRMILGSKDANDCDE